jgi:hypothetical protein
VPTAEFHAMGAFPYATPFPTPFYFSYLNKAIMINLSVTIESGIPDDVNGAKAQQKAGGRRNPSFPVPLDPMGLHICPKDARYAGRKKRQENGGKCTAKLTGSTISSFHCSLLSFPFRLNLGPLERRVAATTGFIRSLLLIRRKSRNTPEAIETFQRFPKKCCLFLKFSGQKP